VVKDLALLEKKIDEAVIKGNAGITKVPEGILELKAMSRRSWKIFRNELFSGDEPVLFLEIGTWLGGALAASVYGNKNLTTYVVENFCEFVEYDNRNEFTKNMNLVKDTCGDIFHIDSDAFKIDVASLEKTMGRKVDVYFYDAGHCYDDQKMAFTYYNDILDDTFIAIVDDFNHAQIINGTFDAFRELEYKVHRTWAMEESYDANIFFISLITKKPKERS
jgi:hypothetical protein